MQALLQDYWPYVVTGGVVSISMMYLAYRRMTTRPVKIYPRDMVILHQIGRGPAAPSLSPFPLKLETYLRMAKIPYQNEHGMQMSSKGKTPWMTYNDVEIADSQFCIDYLTKHLGKDMSAHMSAKERAVARAFLKMVEENLYWCLLLQRWVYTPDNWKFLCSTCNAPKLIIYKFSKRFKQAAHAQGMGRHSYEEIQEIGKSDMRCLSTFLGFLCCNVGCILPIIGSFCAVLVIFLN